MDRCIVATPRVWMYFRRCRLPFPIVGCFIAIAAWYCHFAKVLWTVAIVLQVIATCYCGIATSLLVISL
jgi:hypothetical protein